MKLKLKIVFNKGNGDTIRRQLFNLYQAGDEELGRQALTAFVFRIDMMKRARIVMLMFTASLARMIFGQH